ncbi:MAG: aldehyde ferredoxin oxidoreductase family protein [Candidatus Binatia bacterium]
MSFCGWTGRILHVDLSSGAIERQPLAVGFAHAFLGGQGFAEKLILDAYDFSERDPFSPKNILCIAPGTLTGTLTPGSGRLTVAVALSPSLGGYLDANAGGQFAAELKYANYDAVVITGAAPHPVYLRIADDCVELRDARHLWGKRVRETDRMLSAEVGLSQYARLIIGPAGENRAHGAMPTCDLYRAPSGGSTGAVFGSKNLKAIVAKGTRGVRVARPDDAFAAFQAVFEKNRAEPRFRRFGEQGTKWLVELSGTLNCQYNVQARDFPYGQLSVERFQKEFATGAKACHACFQHCDHRWVIPAGDFMGEQGSGGEAGTIIPLGPACGVSDYATILHLTNLVNDLGLDSISTGSAVATSMHWWQEGLLTAEDTGGLRLVWGNTEAEEELIVQIAERRGFGAVLAGGLFTAASEIAGRRGLEPERLTRFIRANRKQREVPADFRPLKGLAFSRGFDIRECDVLTTDTLLADGSVDYERFRHIGVPERVAREWADSYIGNPMVFDDKSLAKFYSDNHVTVCNSLGICQRFTTWAQMRMGLEDIARCTRAVTGMDVTWEELYRAGDRIRQVEQAMQLLHGFRKTADYFPDSYYGVAVQQGRFEGAVLDRDEYSRELENLYRLRGWDTDGRPTPQRLGALGLDDVAARLRGASLLAAE